MGSCKYCGEQIETYTGRRPKQFCDKSCRVAYFNKNKPKNISMVRKSTYDDVLVENNALKARIKELEKGVYDDRTNPLINAARGRDESGINEDELRIPETLQELKTLCPKELTGLERSQWIANKRQEYGL